MKIKTLCNLKIENVRNQIIKILSNFGTEEDYFYGRLPKEFKLSNNRNEILVSLSNGRYEDDIIIRFAEGYAGNYSFGEYAKIVANNEFYICFSNEEFENDFYDCVKTYFKTKENYERA